MFLRSSFHENANCGMRESASIHSYMSRKYLTRGSFKSTNGNNKKLKNEWKQFFELFFFIVYGHFDHIRVKFTVLMIFQMVTSSIFYFSITQVYYCKRNFSENIGRKVRAKQTRWVSKGLRHGLRKFRLRIKENVKKDRNDINRLENTVEQVIVRVSSQEK